MDARVARRVVRDACAVVAYDAAADPVQAARLAEAFGFTLPDEADVRRDLGRQAAEAWRAVQRARLAFFAACGAAQ